ncbi:MAG: aldo/keto reductase, partial [Bacteroidetes bacterium]|nr:aldo/keto reductase [Bacteroidota bacterium]
GGEVSLISAALLFCTSFEEVSTVIPGAVSVAQLKGNIRAMRETLDPALRDALMQFFEQEVRALRLPW